jgi:putative membrane protein
VKAWRLPAALLVAWVMAMIAIPIVRWTLGDEIKLHFIVASVVLQAATVLVILLKGWGWRRTAKTAVLVTLITLIVEIIGSSTGLPFGQYAYTDLLQPQIMHVPLLIPLAWLMMLPPAWATASFLLRRGGGWKQRLGFILLSGLALTAWDLLLDPQMVSWNLWQWQEPGAYFGIPWLNYVGWFLTAALLTAILRPQKLPIRPLLIVYTVTWFLEVVGLALFWGMPGPAVVGGVAMYVFVWLGWRHAPPLRSESRPVLGREAGQPS